MSRQTGEPTFGLDGEEGTPVTELPNWHNHPECVYANGRGVLTHGHGPPWSKPEPHTHLPVEAWGKAVPLSDDTPPVERDAASDDASRQAEPPPTHDGPCTRSYDPDGKPLRYCAECFRDMPARGPYVTTDQAEETP